MDEDWFNAHVTKEAQKREFAIVGSFNYNQHSSSERFLVVKLFIPKLRVHEKDELLAIMHPNPLSTWSHYSIDIKYKYIG